MNRSSRGFGLAGVLFAVIVMVLTAFFGARAEATHTESVQSSASDVFPG